VADHAAPLLERGAPDDPFALFGTWFDEAGRHVRDPEAVAVATADREGRPSVRMVLLKSWDRRGFVFFTNYASRKGRELTENVHAAMLFHWNPLGRQVRIEGTVERVDPAESDRYFASRPRGAQVGARASHQSRPVADRAELDRSVERAAQEWAGREVERPAWWGGFRLAPVAFEFWQHREDRLHDRLRYTPEGARWRIERLQP